MSHSCHFHLSSSIKIPFLTKLAKSYYLFYNSTMPQNCPKMQIYTCIYTYTYTYMYIYIHIHICILSREISDKLIYALWWAGSAQWVNGGLVRWFWSNCSTLSFLSIVQCREKINRNKMVPNFSDPKLTRLTHILSFASLFPVWDISIQRKIGVRSNINFKLLVVLMPYVNDWSPLS